MAEDGKMNGENGEDRVVDISGYETPDSDSKTAVLREKVAALEQENSQLMHEKEVMEKRISDLKQLVGGSEKEIEELKGSLEKSQSEVKTLESVAARAAQLESEVSRLQHDLINTMSALEESNSELAGAKAALQEAKKSESEKGVKLDAVMKERDLLVKKYEDLEVKESETRDEVDGKEKEIRGLKEKIEELMVSMAKNGEDKQGLEGLRSDLERKVKELGDKVVMLEGMLEEKQKVIIQFEEKGRSFADGDVSGKAEVKSKEFVIGGKKLDWPLVAGSVAGTIGVVGVLCYLRFAKRT